MSGEVVPVTRPEDIAALPIAQRGEVITRALEESKSWLAVATKGTDPTPIAEFRAWAATVAEMTRQKGLAEEIQLDALEMVRRAERGMGVAIRNGQEAGQIATAVESKTYASQVRHQLANNELVKRKPPPSDFVTPYRLLTGNGAGIYHLTDDVSDDQFEQAVTEARDEGNLARTNVVRKIQKVAGAVSRTQRAEKIREMAAQGYSSRQMAAPLGVADTTIREIARAHSITIPADRIVGKTHQIDPERIVQETVITLQGIEYGLRLLTEADYDAFTPEQARAWLGALNEPARAIRILLKELNRRV